MLVKETSYSPKNLLADSSGNFFVPHWNAGVTCCVRKGGSRRLSNELGEGAGKKGRKKDGGECHDGWELQLQLATRKKARNEKKRMATCLYFLECGAG